MKKEIASRADIEHLVDRFYEKVVADDLIGHFFNQVVKLDWDVHMPVMYDFWETILLGQVKYRGNPMEKHFALNRVERLTDKHFDRWLELWHMTVDHHFDGTKAAEAKSRATQIGGLMKFKISQMNE